MLFLSETLYCALPGKNKTQIAYIKFPESIEVYLLYNIVYYVTHPYLISIPIYFLVYAMA
jgi:hypothetical protein